MGNFQNGGDRRGGFSGGRGGRSGGYSGDRGGSRGGYSNDRGGDRRNSFGGDRDRERTMHKAVCADCGKDCEVPFRPSGDKPVLCSNCFGGKRDGGDRAPRREFNSRPSYTPSSNTSQEDMKKQLADLSVKIDRLVNVVEKLVGDKGNTNSPSEGGSQEKPFVVTKSVKKATLKTAVKKALKK